MRTRSIILIAITFLALSSCSVKKFALKNVSKALSGSSGDLFAAENDLELVGESLPVFLKTYDALIAELPDDQDLLLAAGKAYAMYSFAFVYTPSELAEGMRFQEKETAVNRAKKLYLRAKDYLLRSIPLKNKNFLDSLKDNPGSTLSAFGVKDIEKLYWLALSWMGAFNCDKFDMELSISSGYAVQILKRCLELDETFNNGGIHEFFVTYYGSIPPAMGGSPEKAREHFKRAVELSRGKKGSIYLALALSVSVNEQNAAEFRDLLGRTLAIDTEMPSPERLENILAKRRAAYFLAHMDDYFLID